MSRISSYIRTHGSLALIGGATNAVRWRLRDALLARRLHAPGFQAARSPRLLGLTHIYLGPDFHARDFLWLEAVVHYRERGEEAEYEPELRIGASARLSDNVHIGCLNRVTIGDHLLCGSRVLITDHAHGSYNGAAASNGPAASDPAIPPSQRPLASSGPVWIGNNVWLGDGVAVLAGAEIGDGCVIGANSVVTGAIPAGTIAVGSPARPVRRWDVVARAWLPVAQGCTGTNEHPGGQITEQT